MNYITIQSMLTNKTKYLNRFLHQRSRVIRQQRQCHIPGYCGPLYRRGCFRNLCQARTVYQSLPACCPVTGRLDGSLHHQNPCHSCL